MANSSFTFKGGKELEANLHTLTDRVAVNVMVGATFAGAKVIRDRARKKARQLTGNLFRNIFAGRSRSRDKNVVKGITGIGGDAYYGRFIEFGTQHAPAFPFMRPAADEGKEAAVEALVEYAGNRIEKEAAKAGAGK